MTYHSLCIMSDSLMVGLHVGKSADGVIQCFMLDACLSQHVDADVLRYLYGQRLRTLIAIQPVAYLPKAQQRFLNSILSIVSQFLTTEETPAQRNEPWANGYGYVLKVVLHVVF